MPKATKEDGIATKTKLQSLFGTPVRLTLFKSRIVEGVLGKVDEYLNVRLERAKDASGADLGTVIVRGNMINDVEPLNINKNNKLHL